jgi:hypothetical protein
MLYLFMFFIASKLQCDDGKRCMLNSALSCILKFVFLFFLSFEFIVVSLWSMEQPSDKTDVVGMERLHNTIIIAESPVDKSESEFLNTEGLNTINLEPQNIEDADFVTLVTEYENQSGEWYSVLKILKNAQEYFDKKKKEHLYVG